MAVVDHPPSFLAELMSAGNRLMGYQDIHFAKSVFAAPVDVGIRATGIPGVAELEAQESFGFCNLGKSSIHHHPKVELVVDTKRR